MTATLRYVQLGFACAPLALFCGLLVGTAQAETVTNLEYGVAGETRLQLDVAWPGGSGPALFPVVIVVHGGGWGSGDKADYFSSRVLSTLSMNYTCFSIDYRLAPASRWPACFQDLQTAVRWVKAHAASYRGDAQRLALIGYSAGGHLAVLAAVTADEDTRIQAVVGFAPPTDLEADCERRGEVSLSLQHLLDRPARLDPEVRKLLRELSPVNHLKAGLPPFLLIHGTEDKSVPYNQSVQFQARLQALQVPCELITIKGAPHDIRKWSNFSSDYSQQLTAWLAKTFPWKNRLSGNR